MRNLLLIAFVLSLAVPSFADSLYPTVGSVMGGSSLFADAKAHKVGDILTIQITETASGSTTAETNTAKTENSGLGAGTGMLSGFQGLGLSGNTGYDAKGSTVRADSLVASIAVTVKQVNPNGTMLIEGTRSVGTNNDVQLLTLTGTIRQEDISPQNTVPSPLVADAQIKYSGKGPVADRQHEGTITKLFKWLF